MTTVVVPWVSIYINLDEWDARAKALGGTSNTLAAGLARNSGSAWGADAPMTAPSPCNSL